MSIPDHSVMYQRMTSANTRHNDSLPDWVYKQALNYPPHPKHWELVQQYQQAYTAYCKSTEIVRYALTSQLKDPTDNQKLAEVDRCQKLAEQSKQELARADQELRDFNNHSPEQRISLVKVEISALEPRLEQAKSAEVSYVQSLLDNPDIQRRRLERQVRGEGSSEYSSEQIAELRRLSSEVKSLEGKILNCLRDIQLINQLVAQEERKAQIGAVMDAALPKFNDACAGLHQAWLELQSIASEHGIRVNTQALKIPTEAVFNPGENSPYGRPASVTLLFERQ